MDIYDREFILFWSALNKYKVRYIMVEGFATNLHGYSRTTDDINLWIEDTANNRQSLREALKEYSSVDYFMLDYMQIVPGWTYLNLNNGVRLDLMTDMKGLENTTFNQCLSMASVADIDNMQVPFLHINHLILNKKTVNRPKDQIDVIYLQKIKQLQQDNEDRQKEN